jgi:hypothetical protein
VQLAQRPPLSFLGSDLHGALHNRCVTTFKGNQMILTVGELIPHADVGAEVSPGRWVRAMHEPFRGGLFDRLRDAAAVLKGRDVFAVRWPKPGEFEDALRASQSQ